MMARQSVGQEFVILITLLAGVCSAQRHHGVMGPPHTDETELTKVGHIGDKIKLVCPISGNPAPMFEWSKDGIPIDFRWERHFVSDRLHGKFLKIKHLNEDDTGIYTCKGINGFGSSEVRINLLVVDPRSMPDMDGVKADVAPPVFTHQTQISEKYYRQKLKEIFKVSCEAIGSPQPEIFWFKDGKHIDRNVHFQNGKSTVEFVIFGTADSGSYKCSARNLFGVVNQTFTLEVEQPSEPPAVVTEVVSEDSTVYVQEMATLHCKVTAKAIPEIKWLKKLEPFEMEQASTLKVQNERYRIMDEEQTQIIKTGAKEYVNKLVIPDATLSDGGTYICFVTNSGFDNLIYKSLRLTVQPRPEIRNENEPAEDQPEDWLIYAIAISLSIIVGIGLIVIVSVICCKKNRSNKDSIETQSSTGACSDVERPFIIRNNNFNKPLPPTPLTLAQWSNAIHPGLKYADSGFNENILNNSKEHMSNQYEVPYAHLLKPYRPPEEIYFTQEAFMQPQNSNYRPPTQNYSRAASINAKRYYQEYESQ